MGRSWTIGRKVGLGFAVAVVAVIVVGAIGYQSASRLVATGERVVHTHEVQAELSRLLLAIVNTEASIRGNLLSADGEFLTAAAESRTEAMATFEKVVRLTADNPRQQERFRGLREQMARRFALLDDQLENTRAAAPGAEERRQALTKEGRTSMLAIRTTIAAADHEEATLLQARQSASDASTSFARVAIVGAAVVSAVLAILLGIWIVGSVSKQVHAAVADVRSSSTQLQAAANQQASGATEQSSAMSEIASTTNELLASSRQIAETAGRVSQIAGETTTAAVDGDKTIGRAAEASRAVRQQFDQIVTHMLALGRQSQEIDAIVDVVRELADQTNILAINATVEAAGAGDAGKRFGVVADEIRRLADRVGGSTKDIRRLVDGVRGAVHTTVMVTEAGSKAVDAGAEQVIASGDVFRKISTLVGRTKEAAREIELSTKQQVTAVEQVNLAVSGSAQAARETQATAEQTATTSHRLTELSSELMRIVTSQA